jgi:hypothetical protein
METSKPIIFSLKAFRSAIRITTLISPMTGISQKAYNLIYGFKGNALYIMGVNTVEQAYKSYLSNFEYYDTFHLLHPSNQSI